MNILALKGGSENCIFVAFGFFAEEDNRVEPVGQNPFAPKV
jgi:hypothetical protein